MDGEGMVGKEEVGQTISHALKHWTFLAMKSSGW